MGKLTTMFPRPNFHYMEKKYYYKTRDMGSEEELRNRLQIYLDLLMFWKRNTPSAGFCEYMRQTLDIKVENIDEEFPELNEARRGLCSIFYSSPKFDIHQMYWFHPEDYQARILVAYKAIEITESLLDELNFPLGQIMEEGMRNIQTPHFYCRSVELEEQRTNPMPEDLQEYIKGCHEIVYGFNVEVVSTPGVRFTDGQTQRIKNRIKAMLSKIPL